MKRSDTRSSSSRADRLEKALRANLKRRKAQARARQGDMDAHSCVIGRGDSPCSRPVVRGTANVDQEE